mmetsp:Transcript_38171/g.85523  ORF Transcript_38171/g.85523 Transcript_38171/m.85523 type:complete len:98 (+) Transcript_38171:2-295(+)
MIAETKLVAADGELSGRSESQSEVKGRISQHESKLKSLMSSKVEVDNEVEKLDKKISEEQRRFDQLQQTISAAQAKLKEATAATSESILPVQPSSQQ